MNKEGDQARVEGGALQAGGEKGGICNMCIVFHVPFNVDFFARLAHYGYRSASRLASRTAPCVAVQGSQCLSQASSGCPSAVTLVGVFFPFLT